MIDYKLALELKEAGFPGSEQWGHISDENNKHVGFVNKYGTYEVPTLSELVEGCGDFFKKLIRFSDDDWWAGFYEHKYFESGKTPEEAVAKLWLKLNTDRAEMV